MGSRSITTSYKHCRSQLITPFWVLADIISCWCFLLLLYLPMALLLFVVGAIERMTYGTINDHPIMQQHDELHDNEDGDGVGIKLHRPKSYAQWTMSKSINSRKKRILRN